MRHVTRRVPKHVIHDDASRGATLVFPPHIPPHMTTTREDIFFTATQTKTAFQDTLKTKCKASVSGMRAHAQDAMRALNPRTRQHHHGNCSQPHNMHHAPHATRLSQLQDENRQMMKTHKTATRHHSNGHSNNAGNHQSNSDCETSHSHGNHDTLSAGGNDFGAEKQKEACCPGTGAIIPRLGGGWLQHIALALLWYQAPCYGY